LIQIKQGDCREVLKTLPDESVHCVVTSPPYFGLRDYGVAGQIGLEEHPDGFVSELVAVFSEVRRVLRGDGTLWLNLGDSYGTYGGDIFTGFNARYSGTGLDGGKQADIGESASAAGGRVVKTGLRPKNLLGVPWRVALALQADGWWLRQDIIWHKPNPMPESVTDRCTKAHEYIFLLAKCERYYFDHDAIAEPSIYGPESGQKEGARGSFRGKWENPSEGSRNDGSFRAIREKRNKRSVWTVGTQVFAGGHFATFPPDLIEPCILAGCPEGGTVLDPFGGAGTTGLVADRHKRNAVLIEINPEYAEMARKRIYNDAPLFAEVT
jgi:DNA modification methylase